MKKNAFVFALLSLVVFFTSCKKDETPDPENNLSSVSVNDFFPLSEGSYWVYAQSNYDANGNLISQMPEHDSVVVGNDTTINSKTYHKIYEFNYIGMSNVITKYYRDSADCIVDEQGRIIFSIKNPGLVYHHVIDPDTIAYVDYYYVSSPENITVPLGTFSCTDYKGLVHRQSDNYSIEYPIHRYCSEDIGPVKKTEMFLNSLYTIRFELISYHIQ